MKRESLLIVKKKVLANEVGFQIPLLAEEGWRDSLIEAVAPGWSVRPKRFAGVLLRLRPIGLALRATPSAPPARGLSAHPPLLCEERNGPDAKTGVGEPAGRALHKKSWAVIDRPYSLGCATVGALYERPRCIFCAKPAGSKKAAKRYTEAIRAVGPTLNKWRMAWKVC